ncbi:hypothetical protein DFQ04_1374 [Algoriphagus boseongensis]|uniref:Uncharacterized protein n=1 Tax=Algoriphagus boseongensis TaxID=1442587 RepID=A0A4R6T9T5_9BACT|nr:hypothetical protein DFQ04_1374 [Algoriphagus boseongensis]
MTGGIGFSRQGKQSFEENHKLGKIRNNSLRTSLGRKVENSDSSQLEESLQFQNLKRVQAKGGSWKLVLISVLILLVIVWIISRIF